MKKCGVILFFCALTVSCMGNAKNEAAVDNTEGASAIQQFDVFDNRSEEEKIRDLLHAQDELAIEWDRRVSFVKKVNFGIPDGDNWLIEWETPGRDADTGLHLYIINGQRIIKRVFFGNNFTILYETKFDIMKDIPGTHIGNGTSSVGDFNGDGIEEIFQYGFFGYGKTVHIYGYDDQKNNLFFYCSIPFAIIDPENGPAPVEFITYKGMEGFKVYYVELSVAGGIGYVPEPMPDNNKWFFYSWDAAKREYARIEEVVE